MILNTADAGLMIRVSNILLHSCVSSLVTLPLVLLATKGLYFVVVLGTRGIYLSPFTTDNIAAVYLVLYSLLFRAYFHEEQIAVVNIM